ncbi:MAG: hypothetical protein WA739_23150, partial [Candidatus Acidiferrales bacterium]
SQKYPLPDRFAVKFPWTREKVPEVNDMLSPSVTGPNGYAIKLTTIIASPETVPLAKNKKSPEKLSVAPGPKRFGMLEIDIPSSVSPGDIISNVPGPAT